MELSVHTGISWRELNSTISAHKLLVRMVPRWDWLEWRLMVSLNSM